MTVTDLVAPPICCCAAELQVTLSLCASRFALAPNSNGGSSPDNKRREDIVSGERSSGHSEPYSEKNWRVHAIYNKLLHALILNATRDAGSMI